MLHDDGTYSAIWGNYEGKLCLGTRWNGDDKHPGYPSQMGNPLWYVEPEFLTKGILLQILSQLLTLPGIDRSHEYIRNTLAALDAFLRK